MGKTVIPQYYHGKCGKFYSNLTVMAKNGSNPTATVKRQWLYCSSGKNAEAVKQNYLISHSKHCKIEH